MSALHRFFCRYMFWRGHSVAWIAQQLDCTMNDVEAVLFARVVH